MCELDIAHPVFLLRCTNTCTGSMSQVAMEEGTEALCGLPLPTAPCALCAVVMNREWCWTLIDNINHENKHPHRGNVLRGTISTLKRQQFFLTVIAGLARRIVFPVCSASHQLTVYCHGMLGSNILDHETHFMTNKVNNRHITMDLLVLWIYLSYQTSHDREIAGLIKIGMGF